MRQKTLVKLLATVVAGGLIATTAWVTVASASGGPNLSIGKAASASSVNAGFVASNLDDGNQATYWESSGALPQSGQVDLGTATSIDQVVLKLPTGWGARTETLSIQGSPDGTSYSTIVSSAGRVFDPASSNVVTINFTATTTRFVRVNITANTGWAAAQLSELEVYGTTTSTSNLAAGRPTSESGHSDVYPSGNTVDGNQATYWESVNNAFPQWAQVDLGASVSINKVVLKIPAGWGARNQTLSVQGSTNNSTFTDIVASAQYAFSPSTAANSVTINFGSTTTRYVRIRITANSAWPAGQLSEIEIYGPGGTADTTAPSVPGTLSYTQSGTSINLSWGASTDNTGGSGMAGYDIYRNGTLATSVGAGVTTFTDAQPTTATVSYYVRARDVAGNQSGNSNTVTRTGTTPDTTAPTTPGTLSYTQSGTTIALSWGASTDTGGSGLAGYDIYRNGTLAASTNATTTTWSDTQATTATVSYYVKARDGAGNVSGNSNTVTRTGTTPDTTAPTTPGTLSYTQSGTTINLSWGASTDTGGSGLAGYDVYRNGALAGSTNATTTTFADTQATTVTVSYYVKARDGAGNTSANSNTVTRTGTGGGSNLALNKTITATGSVFTFVPTNANDGNVTTYWEGSATYPQNLTVALGANAVISSVNVKLNPDPAWGTRTQNIQVLGRDQASGTYTNLVSATNYTFVGGTNVVSIPVSATVADVQLRFTSNTGAPSGQVAEFEVIGTPAPNPDLTVSNVTWSPASPTETTAVTLTATVNNIGDAASAATNVNFYLGTVLKGSANVGAIAAGGSSTVNLSAGALTASTYVVTAKVDEANTVIEKNDGNNSTAAGTSLVVTPIQSADIVPVTAWSPGNPSAGNTVTFSVTIKNQGNIATSSAAHGITLTLLNDQGGTVTTKTGSFTGAIAAGASSSVVNLGTWTAVNGKYTVRVALAADSAEQSVKTANNTADSSFYVGRGANMPFDNYEAEDGTTGGGAAVVGPNRVIGDLAGEASGRKAVTLGSTGSYVQWTTKASTNTLVTRFSIPDSAGGGGTTSSLSIYVDNVFMKSIPLNSKYAWLYGAETGPGNSPGAGPRHIYDEANIMLDSTVAAGHTIKLQRDSGQGIATIDFISLEQVSPVANPDATKYVVPVDFTQQAVVNAVNTARQDTSKLGVYLPAGDYQMSGKVTMYGRGLNIIGAGPWYTRLFAPQNQENTDIGFDTQTGSDEFKFQGLSIWGNYTFRNDGPGKPFNLTNLANITIDNVWIEHTVVGVWATHINNVTITNSRFRDTYADGVNFTNGSRNNLVSNNEARSTVDSFALFNAQDLNGSGDPLSGNVFQNLTAITTWRAAAIAVYGGSNNIFQNLYIADMLTYSGVTISSLDFGYPFKGFDATPPTVVQNATIVRSGGHFWGAQVFPAIWCFSASKEFRGIRVTDVDIIDPTYGGIMFQTKYTGSTPEFPVTDTIFTNISISGAQKSGDAYDARSGWGIWANEMPEAGQGPAVGSVTFNHVTFTNTFQNVRNTTSTFTITINQ